MLKKARQLNNEVLGERIGMEKARIRQGEVTDDVERLERERVVAQGLLDAAEHADTVVKYELQELTSEHQELVDQLAAMHAENEREVAPELERLRTVLEGIEGESEDITMAMERDKTRQTELAEIYRNLETNEKALEREQAEAKVSAHPDHFLTTS